MKILILKPSSLGDVIQALPVLRLLKLAHPTSEIHWWIDSRLTPLLAGDPDLAQVIPFERHGWNKLARWRQLGRDLCWLREQKYDVVIDLQCLARSGTVAWLANGRFTVGLDEPREGARGYYDRIVRRPSFHTHAVDWYLGVLPLLGVPVHWNFTWLPERRAVAQGLRDKWQVDRSRWIVLQPGARWLNKRWPVGHFAGLVTQLALRLPDYQFAIMGGADDREMGETIAASAPKRCLNLAGQLSLPEMVEWLRVSELMVTNDTGPMHAAAALGKPVVALFGPTEPHRTGPYGQVESALRQPLPCVPCLKSTCSNVRPLECLETITPARVTTEVLRRLGAKG